MNIGENYLKLTCISKGRGGGWGVGAKFEILSEENKSLLALKISLRMGWISGLHIFGTFPVRY